MDEKPQKSSKHVCMTIRTPLGISSDMELDIIRALDDEDVMTMVRGLAHEPLYSPYEEGAFGMDQKKVSETLRKMKAGGLVMSHKEGPDHVYTLNENRFRTLEKFIDNLFKA